MRSIMSYSPKMTVSVFVQNAFILLIMFFITTMIVVLDNPPGEKAIFALPVVLYALALHRIIRKQADSDADSSGVLDEKPDGVNIKALKAAKRGYYLLNIIAYLNILVLVIAEYLVWLGYFKSN